MITWPISLYIRSPWRKYAWTIQFKAAFLTELSRSAICFAISFNATDVDGWQTDNP